MKNKEELIEEIRKIILSERDEIGDEFGESGLTYSYLGSCITIFNLGDLKVNIEDFYETYVNVFSYSKGKEINCMVVKYENLEIEVIEKILFFLKQ